MGQGNEGSFENPINIEQLLDLAPVEYRRFVKINGATALFDDPQVIDWADQTIKDLGGYFLIEIGENVFYQRLYMLNQGLTPVRTHVIKEETDPYHYTKFLELVERAKKKDA